MFSLRVGDLRRAKNLSQVELARALGVSKQSVSNWENDNIQPSIDMLVRIAEYFGVTTDYLLGRDEELTLRASGLTPTQRAHVQAIIDDLRRGGAATPDRRG